MKRTIALLPLLALVACAATQSPSATVLLPGGGSAPAASAITTPGNTAALLRAGRFPAGEGTPLVDGALVDAFHDRSVSDGKLPQVDRVAAAERLLGIKADREGDDFVFRGVTPRTVLGPFGCRELRIGKAISIEGPTDHAACGLPYMSQSGTANYIGPGARYSVRKLEDVAHASESDPSAMLRLGKPDEQTATERTWFGVGGRDEDAPISCHALRIPVAAVAAAKVEHTALARCTISWPPDPAAFARGTEQPAPLPAAITWCAACDPSAVCVLDQSTPRNTRTKAVEGGVAATYLDGRPAKIEITRRCAPPPASNAICTGPNLYGSAITNVPGQPTRMLCQHFTN